MRVLFFAFFLLYFSSAFCNQEELNPQFEIQAVSPYKAVQKGKNFLIAIEILMYEEDWHTYWSFPGDYGLPVKVKASHLSSLSLKEPKTHSFKSENSMEKDLISIKPLPLPRPERKLSAFNNKKFYSFVYYDELLMPFEIFIPEDYKGSTLNLNFDLEWGLCKTVCLFLQDRVSLTLKIADSFIEDTEIQKKFDFWKSRLPTDSTALNLKVEFTETDPNNPILFFSFDKEIQCLDVFPGSREDFSTSLPRVISQDSKSCAIQIKKSEPERSDLSGLLIYSQSAEKNSVFFTAKRKKKQI